MVRRHTPNPVPPPAAVFFENLTHLALCFQIIATALYYNGWMHPLSHKMLLAQFLAVAAWFFYLIYSVLLRKFVVAVSPYYWPALVLCVWAGLRAFTAPNADAPRNYWIFINIVAAFPLWITAFRHPRFRRWFAGALLFAGACMAAGCLRQMAVDDPKFEWPFFRAITLSKGSYERQELGSFMGHNNDSSEFLGITMLYAGFWAYRFRRSLVSLVFVFYILLSLVLIYLAGSRGVALMVLVCGLFLAYAALSRRGGWAAGIQALRLKLSPRWILSGAAGLAGLLLALVVILPGDAYKKMDQNVIRRFFTSPETLLSGTYPRVWWLSVLMAGDHPLVGVGFSSWPYKYPFYQKKWFTENPQTSLGLPEMGRHSLQAHNDYLQMWAELGLVGLVCMLWLFYVHARVIRRVVKLQPVSPLGLTAAAATLGLLTRAVFGFPFHMAAASSLFLANLALLSAVVGRKDWVWEPAWLTQSAPRAQAGLAAGIVAGLLVLCFPIYRMILADYAARSHGIWAYEAMRAQQAGKQEAARRYLDYGYRDFEYAVQVLPHQGKYLYELGSETVMYATASRNQEMLRKGIAYLEKSLESYSFYSTFAYLGRAYRMLWEETKNPEYWQKAVDHFQETVGIMPTFEEGYVQLALLYGKNDQLQKSLDLLSETELRYPGFIERGMLEAAHAAEASQDIPTATILYNLAASITPNNKKLFQDTILFFLKIGRMDMAVLTLNRLAPHQEPGVVVDALTSLLVLQLEQNQAPLAAVMMRDLRKIPELQSVQPLWYYSGAVSWIAGQPWESAVCWATARDRGVLLTQLDPPLTIFLEKLVNPLIPR